jgi:hypothetical protein
LAIPNKETPNDSNSDFIVFTFMDLTSRSISAVAASSTLRLDMVLVLAFII